MAMSDKVRVLIVDDIAETRENLRKLLQFEHDIEVVGTARTGKEAIEITRQLKPDVIIMDINMPDMDGITATEAIRKTNQPTQIIILSVQSDPNYMRRAMLAGARDYLSKPPSVDELTAAVQRAGKMAAEEKAKLMAVAGSNGGGTIPIVGGLNGKIIAVYSPKGGVGATTVAVNLGVTLQSNETPVVLVDGNLQFGDIAVFLNEQGKNSIVDLAPRVDELDAEVVESVLITHNASGLKALAAPSRPEYAESVTGEQFTKVLQYLKRMFAYVIVDCSSYLTDITLATLDLSDILILLTTQEIPAIKDARLLFDLLSVLNINRERVLFVLNRYDKRIGITPEKISESFKYDISVSLPFDERVVIPSINRGVPFMLGDKTRPLAKSYLQLAENLRQKIIKLTEVEPVQDNKIGHLFRKISR
ncbi:MAG: response regulator [Anaerolineales bacterium]